MSALNKHRDSCIWKNPNLWLSEIPTDTERWFKSGFSSQEQNKRKLKGTTESPLSRSNNGFDFNIITNEWKDFQT